MALANRIYLSYYQTCAHTRTHNAFMFMFQGDSTTALLCVLCKVSFPSAWELMVHAQAAHMINIYELGTRPQSPRSAPSPPQSPNQHQKESSPSPQDFQVSFRHIAKILFHQEQNKRVRSISFRSVKKKLNLTTWKYNNVYENWDKFSFLASDTINIEHIIYYKNKNAQRQINCEIAKCTSKNFFFVFNNENNKKKTRIIRQRYLKNSNEN